MKKILIIILAVVIAVGAAVGIGIGVKSCNDKKAAQAEAASTTYSTEYLKEEYTIGDTIAFRMYVSSPTRFESMTFVLNNSAEEQVVCKKGELASGKFYIDSDVETIDTSAMEEGYYTLVFYVYEYETQTRHVVNEEPIIFKLVAAE